MTAADLSALFTTPQITTDDAGVHRDAEGRVYVAVEVGGETDFVVKEAGVPDWVVAGIAAVQDIPNPRETVIPGRFPFTYAYDYLRSHAEIFGVPADVAGSRAAVSGWVNERLGQSATSESPEKIRVCVVLAWEYMQLHALRITPEAMARFDEVDGWLAKGGES